MKLINNVPNTSVEYEFTDRVLTVILTADDDYIIESTVIEYMSPFGIESKNFVIEEGGKKATVIVDDIFDDQPHITGTTIREGVPVDIINNIADTTAVGGGDEDTFTLTITSEIPGIDKKYIDTDVIYTNLDGIEEHSEIINLEPYPWGRGEVIINNVDLSKPITINGVFTDAVEITHDLTNCTTNIPEGYIAIGTTIDVTITANEGTEFIKVPQIIYEQSGIFYNTDLEVNGNTASITFTVGDYIDVIIYGECVVVEVIGSDFGSINVYKLTDEQVEEFASKRFITLTDTDPATGSPVIELIDLGTYVDRIKRLYVPVTDGITDVIRCGEHNTNIECVQPKEDRVLLDFGTVTIPYYNGDTVDYEASVKMFLPFIGFIDLDVSYTGRELRLMYDVNVVTGFAVGKLFCDDMLVDVFDVEPATNVIYKVVSDGVSTIGNNTFDEQKQYGLEPFIIIKRYESVTPERNNDSVTGRIGDFAGYSRFIDVDTISNPKMLMSEQELIYDTLRRGVYIE